MKTLIIILLIFMAGCYAAQKKSQMRDALYYSTKALIVTEKHGTKLICKNPSGTNYYIITDKKRTYHKNDTIILNENPWIYQNYKIIKPYKYRK